MECSKRTSVSYRQELIQYAREQGIDQPVQLAVDADTILTSPVSRSEIQQVMKWSSGRLLRAIELADKYTRSTYTENETFELNTQTEDTAADSLSAPRTSRSLQRVIEPPERAYEMQAVVTESTHPVDIHQAKIADIVDSILADEPSLDEELDVPSRVIGEGASLEVRDAVGMYLTDTRKYPLLSAVQEVELARAIEVGVFAEERLSLNEDTNPQLTKDLQRLIRDGKKARDMFFNSNLRLVVSIAKRHTGRGLDFADIIQEGNTGLMRAIMMFDYKKGFKFSTYATNWIKQSILRAIADQGRAIRIPVHRHEKVQAVYRMQRELRGIHHEEPTVGDIAKALGFTEALVAGLLKDGHAIDSLDRPLSSDGGNYTLSSSLADKKTETSAEGHLEEVDKRTMLERAVNKLDEREAYVIRCRFGFNGTRDMTLDEIGTILGISRERVRQIEIKALNNLRQPSHQLDQYVD